jgi:hypothetical protein
MAAQPASDASARAGMADVVGGQLPFQVAGDGPAVVFLHGGLGDARMWDGQWPAFTRRHHAVRYTLRGFAGSVTESVEFSNRDDLVAIMDAAGVERAALIGTCSTWSAPTSSTGWCSTSSRASRQRERWRSVCKRVATPVRAPPDRR